MTTIAYRDGYMAADRQINQGRGIYGTVTKIFRRSDGALGGYSGSLALAQRFTNWFVYRSMVCPLEFEVADGEEGVIIMPDGTITCYEQDGVVQFEAPFYACGSGTAYAMGAMHVGASAKEAVEVACRCDVGSGCGIDVLRSVEE